MDMNALPAASSAGDRPSLGARLYGALGWAQERPVVIVGFITLLGAALRIYHLGFKSLWHDEAVLYAIAHGSFAHTLEANAALNSAPPLYALVVNVISRMGGSEAALRSFSCAAGIAAVPAVYCLAHRFMPRGSAYVCALLAAVCAEQIRYSQELREYSLTFLLAALLMTFFHRILREPSRRCWVLLTLTGTLAMLTQYGLALLVLALNLVAGMELLLKRQRLAFAWRWAAVQPVWLAAAGADWVLAMHRQWRAGGFAADSYLRGGYWQGTLESFWSLSILNTARLFRFVHHWWVPAGALAAIGLLAWLRHARGRDAAALMAAPMAVTFGAALAHLYPYIPRRQNMFLTPMLIVMTGLGFQWLAAKTGRRAAACVVLAALALGGLKEAVAFLRHTGRENLRPVAQALAERARPGDRIYVYARTMPAFRYYYPGGIGEVVGAVNLRRSPDEFEHQLDDLLSRQGRIWMIFTNVVDRGKDAALARAAEWRTVEEVASSSGAWLYRVE